jgi:hypothetical protein
MRNFIDAGTTEASLISMERRVQFPLSVKIKRE